MKLIEVDKISFSYPGHLILDNLNFTANKGSFISILGPSGCGKSTLLNLLSGFKMPDSGVIIFNGKKVTAPFPEGQMIFQDTGQLLPWLTVSQNILLPRFRSSLFGIKKISEEESFTLEKLLVNTGLKKFQNYYPNQLSGGLDNNFEISLTLY